MKGFGWKDIIYIVTIIVSLGVAYGALRGDVAINTEHRLNSTVHMPLSEKIKQFPTRREHEDLKQRMGIMATQIDDIHKYLLEKK